MTVYINIDSLKSTKFCCKQWTFVKLSARISCRQCVAHPGVDVEGIPIILTKTTAAQNEVALRYHKMRRLYFLAVVFVETIVGV